MCERPSKSTRIEHKPGRDEPNVKEEENNVEKKEHSSDRSKAIESKWYYIRKYLVNDMSYPVVPARRLTAMDDVCNAACSHRQSKPCPSEVPYSFPYSQFTT